METLTPFSPFSRFMTFPAGFSAFFFILRTNISGGGGVDGWSSHEQLHSRVRKHRQEHRDAGGGFRLASLSPFMYLATPLTSWVHLPLPIRVRCEKLYDR